MALGKLFEMQIASLSGDVVQANGDMQISVNTSMGKVRDADVVLVPPHMCGIDSDERKLSEITEDCGIICNWQKSIKIYATSKT